MDFGIWTVLISAGSLIIGGLSVYFTLKVRQSARVTFVTESCIGLFDAIVQRLPELAIHYKDQPISERLVFLRGVFINTGNKDIRREMIEENIGLALPKGFRWLEVNVDRSTSHVEARPLFDAEELTFDLGLFRSKERLRFEALVEIPAEGPVNSAASSPDEILVSALEPTHRIADTTKAVKRNLRDFVPTLRNVKASVILSLVVFLVGAAFVVLSYSLEPLVRATYLLKTEENESVKVTILPTLDGRARVISVEDPLALLFGGLAFDETMSFGTFFQHREWKPVSEDIESLVRPIKVLAGVVILIALLVAGLAVFQTVMYRKRWQLLGVKESQ